MSALSGNRNSRNNTEFKIIHVLSVKKFKKKMNAKLLQNKNNKKEKSWLKLKDNFLKMLKKLKCSKNSILKTEFLINKHSKGMTKDKI